MGNVSAAFQVLAECFNRPSDIDYRVTHKLLEIFSTSRVFEICTVLWPDGGRR